VCFSLLRAKKTAFRLLLAVKRFANLLLMVKREEGFSLVWAREGREGYPLPPVFAKSSFDWGYGAGVCKIFCPLGLGAKSSFERS
jgi:hypothetical protein